jgi:hypothetical protein
MRNRIAQRRSVLLSFIVLLLALLACKSKPANDPKLGDKVNFDDSQWQVVKADIVGNNIQGFTGNKKTSGKFLKVEFTVMNTSKQDESILAHPKVYDDQGREFGPLDDQSLYMSENETSMTLESLPPSIMKRFWAIYELPAGAKGLRFEARALAAFGDTRKVVLGI